jgi:hypothetical protein
MNVPKKFSRESFYGFDMADEDVGQGEHRQLAIEIKHLFEGIVEDANEKNEEIFLTPDLEHALRRFVLDPANASLIHLLEISPYLGDTFTELQMLLRLIR